MENNKNNMRQFIIHHSAVSRNDLYNQTNSINNYHKQLWNMKSQLGYYGGYQYTIEPSGKVVQFRKEHEEGMHTLKHNLGYIGICLQGNFLVEMPTEAQIKALREIIRGDDKVYRHCDLQAERICPCLSMEYINNILKDDEAEKLKQEKIIELTGRLDYLISTLLKLLDLIKKKYGKK